MWPDSVALWQYLGVLGALIAAGFGAPVPEEVPIITGGIMVGSADADSTLRWWVMLPVCIFGVVVGDGFLYAIGRLWGRRLLHIGWVKRKVLPPERLEHITERFHKHGIWVLLGARLLPSIRTPIFITAGMTHFPLARFLVADGLYAIPGVTLLFTLSYWFGDRFKTIFDKLLAYRQELIQDLFILVILAAVIGAVVYVILRRPFATGDPPKIPPMPHMPHLPHIPLIHPRPEDGGKPAEDKRDAAPAEPSVYGEPPLEPNGHPPEKKAEDAPPQQGEEPIPPAPFPKREGGDRPAHDPANGTRSDSPPRFGEGSGEGLHATKPETLSPESAGAAKNTPIPDPFVNGEAHPSKNVEPAHGATKPADAPPVS
jgi:membrane protein DedA with SNARE-associated domain